MAKITEQDFIEIFNKYNGCQAKLASHYNLSERSIRNYKAKYIKKDTLEKEQLYKDYCVDRLSIVDIAKKHAISRDYVYKLIAAYDLTRESKYDINQIRQAYTFDNANIEQLIKLTGIKNRISLKNLLNKHNINNPIKDIITDLYKAGLETSEIATIANLSEEQVTFNLKHHSIYREKILNIPADELSTLRSNKTLEQLAKHYNCSTRTVSAYIKKYALDKKDTTKFVFDFEVVKKLYTEQNLTMDEIALTYGCSRKTINDFIREKGIESTNKETKYERTVRQFLESYNIEYVSYDRQMIKPKELDFYLPKYKLAIELCGLYWHSTKINKNKLHIREKHDQCKKAGIRLITIFEDELEYKFDIVLNRLKQLLSLNKSAVYARQCSIQEISNRQGIDFLNAHHIQGAGKNKIYLGAFKENKLLAVMSFSDRNPAKGQHSNIVELNRFANPSSVTGIASKLFKFYLNNYNPDSILSYSDNRWNTGNLYNILGFKLIRETKYNYWYVIRQERKHRFAFTKQRLLQQFPEEDANQTEQEIAEKHNLYRIYDCGSCVYRWER
jgi:G:T-mismatch repair DNA endonuclease (very short patch repair protein)/Mor family transcriptional regulator